MSNTGSATATHAKAHSSSKKAPNKKWMWAKRILTIAFFILVPTLLFMLVKNIEWAEVEQAIRSYSVTTLLLAASIALLSYLVFASYDLVGRHYTGHKLPVRQVLPLAFVCYAFTLNLTAWVGGIALRFRLYSRLGLEPSTITKILSMSLITNWLGYIILAGILFSFRLVDLPEKAKIGETALQLVGFTLLAVAAFYFWACRFSKRRSFHFRSHKIALPKVQLAFIQAALAMLNWSLMGLIIYILMPDKVSYQTILGILLISSIAGVVTHIPAGLGVLEAIFISMLNHQVATGTILAALIGYRIFYFLIPLAIACIVYLTIETRAKKMVKNNQLKQPSNTNGH
ncbi:MAG: lysylphosphatidylglycerol synthase domain-containing protein [Cellvibrio sp.]|uniref:lysylphosphatidylglycerol synthase domain-containing protein n=1 Tax=Cellvibrio sp. TaxID=1965322 RepID=UPI0031A82F5F